MTVAQRIQARQDALFSTVAPSVVEVSSCKTVEEMRQLGDRKREKLVEEQFRILTEVLKLSEDDAVTLIC